jgi:mono/diheme cytochrome c family protein
MRLLGRICSAMLLLICAACGEEPAVKKAQSISYGRAVYVQHCQQCHGADGRGLAKLYPPLAGADYLMPHRDALPCLVYAGLQDTSMVNGVRYSIAMPANRGLYPEEIAHVLTYVLNAWGNDTLSGTRGYVTQAEVQAALKLCE